LALMLGAVVALTRQALTLFDPFPPFWIAAVAGTVAFIAVYILYGKGLLLLKSARPDVHIYHILLAVALFLLVCIALNDPLGGNEISFGWQEHLDSIQDKSDLDKPFFDLLKNPFGLVFGLVKFLVFSAAKVLLTVVLTLAAAILVICAPFMLWGLLAADLKKGVILVLALCLLALCGLAVRASVASNLVYLGAGFLGLSLVAATNWPALAVNGDASQFHPDIYQIVTRLAERRFVSRDSVREVLMQHVGKRARPSAHQDVVDELERRLCTERILVAEDDSTYAVRCRKRLGLSHAILGVLCVVYLANPSMGLFELLPDNLPLVGNLDELVKSRMLCNFASPGFQRARSVRSAEGQTQEYPHFKCAGALGPPVELTAKRGERHPLRPNSPLYSRYPSFSPSSPVPFSKCARPSPNSRL